MIINLSKGDNVSFYLQQKGLLEAVENCNLGSGTIYDPINVDGFVTPSRPDLPTFYAGDVLELEITDTEVSSFNTKLTSCVMENVGKEFNEGTRYPINKWQDIFDIENKAHIQSLPNGSLCIAPVENTISIAVHKDKKSSS